MAKNKKNLLPWILLVVVVVIGGGYMIMSNPVQQTSTGDSGSGSTGCDGLANVDLLFNDFNEYKAGPRI